MFDIFKLWSIGWHRFIVDLSIQVYITKLAHYTYTYVICRWKPLVVCLCKRLTNKELSSSFKDDLLVTFFGSRHCNCAYTYIIYWVAPYSANNWQKPLLFPCFFSQMVIKPTKVVCRGTVDDFKLALVTLAALVEAAQSNLSLFCFAPIRPPTLINFSF